MGRLLVWARAWAGIAQYGDDNEHIYVKGGLEVTMLQGRAKMLWIRPGGERDRQ